jgi:hypothetical protein
MAEKWVGTVEGLTAAQIGSTRRCQLFERQEIL